MSDENLMNLEDDGPALPPPEPVPASPEPAVPVAAAPEADAELDLNAVDLKDEGRIRGLIGELSRLRSERKDLKGAKEQLSQLQQQVAEMKPYADFVRNNPQLLQPRQPEPQTPPPPDADPDAIEAARLMDFYRADGTPDVERGAKWLALQDKRANRVAQTTIQPLQQQSLQERANANYVMLRNFKLANGAALKPEIVDGLWQAAAREPNGLQTLANPESVRALALLAMGAQAYATPQQPAAPAAPPVVTEASGGRPSLAPVRLSALEERVLSQHGHLNATKYADLTKDFKPGRANVLEDD